MPGEFDFGDDGPSRPRRPRRDANYEGEYARETARQQARADFRNRQNAKGCGCLLVIALLVGGCVAILSTGTNTRGPTEPDRPAKAKRP